MYFALSVCCAARYNADNMYLERLIVALCLGFAFVFGISSVLWPNKRRRMIIPAAALSVLGLYELRMDHWEKTVRGPIRLDLFFEIPAIVAFLLWGLVAIAYPSK
jgi:hypothetical protein